MQRDAQSESGGEGERQVEEELGKKEGFVERKRRIIEDNGEGL